MTRIEFTDILSVDDALKDKVRQWRNKEKIRKSMLTQHIISKEEHFSWIESLKQKNNQKFWLVFADNVPIGSVYLQNINHSQLNSEWGFYIGEDAYTGKGLAKQIVYKLLSYFFDVMNFETLFTKVLPINTTALHIYKTFNFIETGKSTTDSGHEVTCLRFSKADWLKIKEDLLDAGN